MAFFDGQDEDLSFGRRKERPTGTLTICARCDATGAYGIATLSGHMAAGAYVGAVRQKTGAAAVQGAFNPYLKFQVLGGLLARKGADLALKEALDEDERSADSQVLVVAEGGVSAAKTGDRVPSWGGHMIGENYAIGGTGLEVEGVVDIMADCFLASARTGRDLADRMIDVLAAGLNALGQTGRERSACLSVSGPGPIPHLDLRVDDDKAPLDRLRTLYTDYMEDDARVDRFLATPEAPEGRIPTQLDEALIYLRRHWLHFRKGKLARNKTEDKRKAANR